MEDLKQELVENCKILVNRTEQLKQIPPNGIDAELGVEFGLFSEQILQNNLSKTLHLIDLWKPNTRFENLFEHVKNKFIPEIDSNKIVINKGYSTEVLTTFPNEFFDWIYIVLIPCTIIPLLNWSLKLVNEKLKTME